MLVKELKEICKLISTNGLIDEFIMTKDGHAMGIDVAKTFMVDLQFNTHLSEDINISNIKGLDQLLSGFTPETDVEIVNNKLHMINVINGIKSTKFADMSLKLYEPLSFNVPNFPITDYKVKVDVSDHNILNELGKMRPNALINEDY